MDISLELSPLVQSLCHLWNFAPSERLTSGWCSDVYASEYLVLKVPWRGEEMTSGFRASLAMQDWFGPRIHFADEETGAILMDRVLPGFDLTAAIDLDDFQRMDLLGTLIERLQSSTISGDFVPLDVYHSIEHPLKSFLIQSCESTVALHGDLHHFNLLWSSEKSQWIPIDPKGLVGEPCYEAIAYLRNEIVRRDSPEYTRNLTDGRLKFFQERLGFEPVRMAAWGWIDQVDSGEDQNVVLANYYKEVVLSSGSIDPSLFE